MLLEPTEGRIVKSVAGATCSRRVIPEHTACVGEPDIPLKCRYPPNSSGRNTQRAIHLIQRLCLSLNPKRTAPKPNSNRVTGIWFQGGRTFKASGGNLMLEEFQQ